MNCKCHSKPYHKCPACQHLYCRQYWASCPRCAAIRTGERVAVWAVLNTHGEPMLLAPTRELCQRHIDTQSPCADLHIKGYPFQPTYDPATGRLS